MSLATTYACFGCVDFANNERTAAYVAWACRTRKFTGPKPQLNWLCTCPDDSQEWTDPVTDLACWYDPLIPESEDFLGIIVTDVKGLRQSVYKREVSDSVTGGSILGKPTRVGKNLVFTALVIASSEGGFDYGMEWLRRQFEGDNRCPKDGSSCSSCHGQVLTLRVHCPNDTDRDRGLRMFPTAGTVDGISLIEDSYPMGRQNCYVMREVTWTMATETDASFSPDPVSGCELPASDPAVFNRLGNCLGAEVEFPCCPICGDTCDSCTTDPGCDCIPPFVLEPVQVGVTAPCFTDPLCRLVGAIGLNCVPSGYEAALRFTFFSGFDPSDPVFTKFGMRNAVIRIWENPPVGDPDAPDDLPEPLPVPTTGDEYDAFVATHLPCAEIGVSWMPAASELVIDGLTGNSWLKCQGECVDHSERVFMISGDMFPLTVRCVPIIATIEWDNLNTQSIDDTGKLPSSMKMETFLRHRI